MHRSRKAQQPVDQKDFFATGRKEIESVLSYADRIGVYIDKTLPALDFGCGIGRLTEALAQYFRECRRRGYFAYDDPPRARAES